MCGNHCVALCCRELSHIIFCQKECNKHTATLLDTRINQNRSIFRKQTKQLEICRVTPFRNESRVLLCSHPVGSLQWRHNGRDGISNHQPHHCSLNLLFRCRSKKTSKISVTGLYAGKSPETNEFPAQIASNAANVSIWWRHHGNLFWQL